jgi:hypothetical protein
MEKNGNHDDSTDSQWSGNSRISEKSPEDYRLAAHKMVADSKIRTHPNPDRRIRAREKQKIKNHGEKRFPLHAMSDKCYNDGNPCDIHPCVLADSVYSALNNLEGKIRSTMKELKYKCCYASCRDTDGTLRLCKRKWLNTTSHNHVCKGHQKSVGFGEEEKFLQYQIIQIRHVLSDEHEIKFPTRVYIGRNRHLGLLIRAGFVVREREHLSLILERANKKGVEIFVRSTSERDMNIDFNTHLHQVMDNDIDLKMHIERLEDITRSIQNLEHDGSNATDQMLNELYDAAMQLPSNYSSMLLGMLLVIVLFYNKKSDEITYAPFH